MNIDRLNRVAVMLDTLPEQQFDMRIFTNDCGTVGCAVGHAAMLPSFQKEGLYLAKNRWGGSTIPAYQPAGETRGLFGWPAIERFFDLGVDEAEWLFIAYSYSEYLVAGTAPLTTAVVADRIRKFIAGEDLTSFTYFKETP